MTALFGAVWRFRLFILSSIKAELKGRFARSRLGALWFILHPLAQSAIFALVLTEVLGARLQGIDTKGAYAIYLLSGMAAWGLFSEILNRCIGIFVEYGSTMKKISFPRLCLPLIVWGGALVNHVLLLFAISVALAFFGRSPSIEWIAILPGMLLISMLAFGLGLMLGIFNVFSRDVAQVMTVIVQLWFWLTPIVYPLEAVPPAIKNFIAYNPMVPLVGVYQQAFAYERWPDPLNLMMPFAVALFLFLLAFLVFQRASSEIVDAL